MRTIPILLLAVVTAVATAAAGEIPDGYWSLDQASEVLERTRRIELETDLGELSPAARSVVGRLLEAGAILHALYEEQTHRQAREIPALLAAPGLSDGHRAALESLHYLFRGPIATTLENERQPFLPVAAQPPGRNVYPWGIEQGRLEAYLARRPEARRSLLAPRSVVRETTPENLRRDTATLTAHPLLAGLHPGLAERLAALAGAAEPEPFYALPYSVRWPEDLLRLHALLDAAATDIAREDPDLAAYLRLRARDLLADDYEGGDAAWVSGRFGALNAQIGSYETYDDALYGLKSFFSLSVLARDAARSDELAAAIAGIQEIQDGLPVAHPRRVRAEMPVGVYNVIADFGQARGANTASILPNEADHARKYGRTILLRYNILTHPALFEDSRAIYRAAVAAEHGGDLTLDGDFYRTLWHEIGHYLGVDRADDGRPSDQALAPWGDLFEELKADLVSLHTVGRLHADGLLDETILRSVRASGVRRVLQRVRPRRDQPYGMMQLMQMNFFLEGGLLAWDPSAGRLRIDYGRYPAVVDDLLARVLAIQAAGDAAAAEAFIDRYDDWEDALHQRLALALREATPYRYYMVRYAALGPR